MVGWALKQPGAIRLFVPSLGNPPQAELLVSRGTSLFCYGLLLGRSASEGGCRDRPACRDCSWCHATSKSVEIFVCSKITN